MRLAKNKTGNNAVVTRFGRLLITVSVIAIMIATIWFSVGSLTATTTPGSNVATITEPSGLEPHGTLPSDNQGLLEIGPSDKAQLTENYGKLPLSFEANQGQTDRSVKFLSRGSGYNLFLTPIEAVLRLRNNGVAPKNELIDGNGNTGSTVLRLKFEGANPMPRVVGVDELAGKSNYFIGKDPAKWRTNIPNYARVRYEGIYPGVDMVYYGNQRQLEYDFVVAPGADPNAIKLGLKGARNVSIDAGGDLLLGTGDAIARLQKPIIYQELDGSRREIEGEYVLRNGSTVAFVIGEYDRSLPLVIDPVLVYSTFLGGSGDDAVYEVAVNGSGNVFATGYTYSSNFPTTTGAFDTTYNGGFTPLLGGASDAFVTKLNSTGTAAIFSTYFGGADSEQGDGIAVDASGNVYVGGGTKSINFPTTVGAYDTACPECASGASGNIPGDAFIAKIDGSTGALLKSTLYGLGDYETAYSLALDSAGNVYIGGGWSGGYCTCLPTVNGFQSARQSYSDEFFAKFNSDLSTLLYATAIGGSNQDFAVQGIVSSSPGIVSLTGHTKSTNFPTTPGAYDTSCGTSSYEVSGTADAFVMTINTNLSGANSLVYSTCLGGSGDDSGGGITVDGSGNIWVTGGTSSTDFPTTPGAYDTTYNGGGDVFVTKLNPSAPGAAQLAYSTFIGGSDGDGGAKVALDTAGNVYVAGSTSSSDFPTLNPLQGPGGGQDAFITQLNPTTNLLVYSTYLGSCATEGGYALALDLVGNAYVGGVTSSSSFPVTAGALQTTFGGVGDGFVTKIGPGAGVPYDACPTVAPTPIPIPTPIPNSTPPPTINAEVASVPPPPGSVVITQTGATPCTTYSFTVTSTASGPYQGTFTATGTFTLEPMTPISVTPNINHRVVGWTENFTINQPISALPPQPVAHVITGTKQIDRSQDGPGYNVAQCSPTLVNPSPVGTTYQATISGLDGTFTDSGIAQSGIVHLPLDPNVASTFFENFTSRQATTTAACVPPPTGMVSWWPGDGNANDIQGTSNAALQGGTTFGPGKVAQAFSLNGTDASVNAGNASNLQVSSGDFTVDAWVNFNALSHPPGSNPGAPQGDMSIVDKMSQASVNGDGWRLIKQDDNRFWFCLGAGSNGCGGQFSPTTVVSTTVATTGVWYHVTAIKSSAGIALYVNGVLESSKGLPSFIDTNSANLLIGANAREGAHLNGSIDEVEIFNRALSGAEIAGIHNAGSAGKCKPTPTPTPSPQFVLTTTKSGAGAGTITSSPAGINCGADCSEPYNDATVVTLTATAGPSSFFVGWTGEGCSGTGTCIVTMNAAKTVNANFGAIYTLTVTKSGTGTGTVTSSPSGINCGTDCTKPYNDGTVVTLTATPDSNSTFVGWSGACTGTGTCSVTMDAAKTVNGNFGASIPTPTPQFVLTTTKSGAGTGTITSSPAGINCGADCSEPYNDATVVTLTATAGPSSFFVGWTGGGCSGTGTCNVTMDAAKTVNANFGASTPTPQATSFVIGDLNAVVGKKVTYWGAQWANLNSLSGGSAPSAFKGYANTTSTRPASCGGTWKSDPGNSSGPPASVPAYITVIVASSITKSGSIISGNISRIVTIKTDPGYDSNPGHAGTGTVMSVVCPVSLAVNMQWQENLLLVDQNSMRNEISAAIRDALGF